MNLPHDVKKILLGLNTAGHDAYIVGGCVRDSLMGTEPSDWDIATSALPDEVKSIFPHTYDTGVQHGTITVLLNKKGYEVTTFRIDGEYKDFRRPDIVAFTKNINEDLNRRDFTINAIAYKPEFYVDPHDGASDIRECVIRGVGDPSLRFQEDALRMLRALRFSAVLSFRIEERTYSAIINNAHLISHISMERIRDELTKLLLSPHPEKLADLVDCGLMGYIFPELKGYFQQNLSFVLACLSLCPSVVPMIYACIFSGLTPDQASGYMTALRFDNKSIKETYTLVKWSGIPIQDDLYKLRKMISSCGLPYFEHILALQRIIALANGSDTDIYDEAEKKYRLILSEKHCVSLDRLAVNGRDLLSIGVPAGKIIGDILIELLELVLHDPGSNTRALLLDKACAIFEHIS